MPPRLLPTLITTLATSLLPAQTPHLNELMIDPNPTIGLPDAEYVELYNPGDTAISLSDLSISNGGRAVTLPTDEMLPPGQYALLIDAEDTAAFAFVPATLVPMRLPALVNSGDDISLLGPSGDTLHTVSYTSEWYADDDRDGGGYSLEYNGLNGIDCPGNWRASLDASGGTPGRTNSIAGSTTDTVPPRVADVALVDDSIIVTFDEPLSTVFPPLFTIDMAPASAPEVDGDGRRYVITGVSARPGRLIDLTVLPNYADCAGNMSDRDRTYHLLSPAKVTPGDVVFNELLFNPKSGGEDYVELYNRSANYVDLRDWHLVNETGATTHRIIESSYLLPPGELVVITEKADVIVQRFMQVDAAKILENRLPSMPDDGGNLRLLSGEEIEIDAVDYREDWHSALLSPPEGVALERSDSQEANDADNWASAATEVGYGTPTRPNSQSGGGSESVSLLEPTFSPDGDGFHDRAEIVYRTPRPGYLARLSIFDTGGQPLLTGARSELLAAEGTLSWDGRDGNRRLLPPGPYVMLLELFAADGRRETFKFVAVLAS